MSYCVHCGVELAASEPCCPLCGVPVQDPLSPPADAPPLYPRPPGGYTLRTSARNAAGIVAVLLLLIPFLTVLACDLSITGSVTWSRYVVLFFPLTVALTVPPLFIRRNKGLFYILIAMVTLTGSLYALNAMLPGDWFFSFALPVCIGLTISLLAVFFLYKLLPRRQLTATGGAFLCAGLFTLLLEQCINMSFYPSRTPDWSYYTLIPCALIGAVLMIIDTSPGLKRTLQRRLFW